MGKKIKPVYWIVGIIVLVLFFGSSYLNFVPAGTTSSFYSFQPNKIYSPVIGTLTCIESTVANQHITQNQGILQQNGFVGNSFKANAFGSDLIPSGNLNSPGTLNFTGLISYQNYQQNTAPRWFSFSTQCLQAECNITESNPKDWYSCPVGYNNLYRALVNGNVRSQNQILNMSAAGNNISSVTDDVLTANEANMIENDTLTLEGACVKNGTSFGAIINSENQQGIDFTANIVFKQLQLNFPQGSIGGIPVYVPSTEGCTWNSVYSQTNGNFLSPNNTSSLGSLVNPNTGLNPVLPFLSNLLPSQLPQNNNEALGVNQQKTFVAGWQEITGVNILTLDNGIKVVPSPFVPHKIYKINSVSLGDGSSTFLANEEYISAAQCIVDAECPSNFHCNFDGINIATLFTCQPNAQGGNACIPATEIQACGSDTYGTQGSGFVYTNNFCGTNNSCQQSTTNIACSPIAPSGSNGCPISTPVCVTSGNNPTPTSCVAQAQTTSQCPSTSCCDNIPGSPYFPQSCPSGQVCQDNGGFIGTCIVPPASCGNGTCNAELGENNSNCPTDCPITGGGATVGACTPEQIAAGNHTEVANTPQFFLGIFQTGVATSTSCVPNLDINLVLIGLIVGVAVIIGFGLLRKKGRR